MSFAHRLRVLTLALVGLVLGAGATRSASAITVDCATAGCIGGVYTLTVESTGTDLYLATYTIDTSVPFSVAGATTLVDIDFKVANDHLAPTLVSGPTVALLDGPLTGGACSGTNGGFVCGSLSPQLAVGSVYTWKIQFGATGLISQDEWHVGARYTGPGKTKGWVISEVAGSPVPEPSAALVFGLGMVVAGSCIKRS